MLVITSLSLPLTFVQCAAKTRLLMLHLGSIDPNAERRKAPVYWGLSVISLAPLAISAADLMVAREAEGSDIPKPRMIS